MPNERTEASYVQPPTPDVIQYLYPTATSGKRFLNYLIDGVAIQAIFFILGTGLGYLGSWVPGVYEALDGFLGFVYVFGVFFGYFAIMEATVGRTLGKILTNTLVLNLRDEKPTLKQFLGRTAARFIPFEPFSFLGASGSGWHDTLPRTKVVDTSKPPNVIGRDLTVKQAIPPNRVPPGWTSPHQIPQAQDQPSERP